MITLTALIVTSLVAWAAVDFAFELAGESKLARLGVVVLACSTGCILPYMALDVFRSAVRRGRLRREWAEACATTPRPGWIDPSPARARSLIRCHFNRSAETMSTLSGP